VNSSTQTAGDAEALRALQKHTSRQSAPGSDSTVQFNVRIRRQIALRIDRHVAENRLKKGKLIERLAQLYFDGPRIKRQLQIADLRADIAAVTHELRLVGAPLCSVRHELARRRSGMVDTLASPEILDQTLISFMTVLSRCDAVLGRLEREIGAQ
jgi:hypothetical protein